jgi:hypothetical protein
VPLSDLEVSRTATKDNTSHYYVNGKKSSAKDVTELLKAKGVDLENSRFLILQVCTKPVKHAPQCTVKLIQQALRPCREKWSRSLS